MIVIVLIIIIGILWVISFYYEDTVSILPATIFSFILGYIISENIHEKYPTAIDVYRNKTTLEITYRDNIPVDSIVVFKK